MVGDAIGLMHQGEEGTSYALASGGYTGEAVIQALGKDIHALVLYKRLVRPEMEAALDQFNPFRVKASSASSLAKQPGLLHGLSMAEKAKPLRNTALFLRSEVEVQGIRDTILKNMLPRLVFRNYRIPAVDSVRP